VIRSSNSGQPVYRRLVETLTDEILAGVYVEGSLLPSTSRLAATFAVSPATAARALNILVGFDVLEMKRGIGASVTRGAHRRLYEQRRKELATRHIDTLLTEASKIGISVDELVRIVSRVSAPSV
jgi:DNA-binding transcriptional regulator YhcF (GntR family)